MEINMSMKKYIEDPNMCKTAKNIAQNQLSNIVSNNDTFGNDIMAPFVNNDCSTSNTRRNYSPPQNNYNNMNYNNMGLNMSMNMPQQQPQPVPPQMLYEPNYPGIANANYGMYSNDPYNNGGMFR